MLQDKLSFMPEGVLGKIGGKWKMPILWRLGLRDAWRYSELKHDLENVSHKMLSQQLKELEKDGLVVRVSYPVIPPKVEYSLTEKGKATIPAISALCNLGSILNPLEVDEVCPDLQQPIPEPDGLLSE
ncbi:transcriptional regulator, HxlR family [candidate division TM7 genomosp. GTL1]|nr:transcriptional regulator, HxlR family [candidate division TM7 genomosp. GTL1]